MPRTFAIASMIITSLLLAGTAGYFYLQFRWAEQAMQEKVIALNDRLIERQLENIEETSRAYRELMQDESKKRFWFTLDVFDAVEQAVNCYTASQNRLIRQRKLKFTSPKERVAQFQQLQHIADSCLMAVIQVMEDGFSANRESVDLNEEELNIQKEGYRKIAQQADLLSFGSDRPSRSADELDRSYLTLAFQDALQLVLTESSSWGCVRGLMPDTYYPVVIANDRYLKPGETKTFKIGIGSYASQLNPEDVDLRVNGLRLQFGRDGLAKYTVTGREKGAYSMSLSSMVIDRESGDTARSEGLYQYIVE